MAPLPSSLEDIRQFSVPLPQEFDARECIGVGCSATHMVLGFAAHIYIYSWPSFDLTHTIEPGKPFSFDRFAVHGEILLIAYEHFPEDHLTDDFSVHLWNLSTGKRLVTLRMSGSLLNTMLSVPRTEFIEMEENSTLVKKEWPLDLTLLAATDGDHTLQVYTFPRSVNQDIEDISVERNPVSTIHFTHQLVCLASLGRTVVAGRHDFTIHVWDTITGECQLVLIGHTTKVNSVDVDHTRIYSQSSPRTIRIWDRYSGDCLHTLHLPHKMSLDFISLSWSGYLVPKKDLCLGPTRGKGPTLITTEMTSATINYSFKVWEIKSGQLLGFLPIGDRISGLHFCAQDRFLMAIFWQDRKCRLHVWDFGGDDPDDENQETRSTRAGSHLDIKPNHLDELD